LVDVAAALSADLRVLGRDYHGIERSDGHWNYADAGGRIDGLPMPALAGVAQVGNAATALAALRAIGPSLRLERAAVERGLHDVHLPGRFQRLTDRRGVEWVFDVAHNPAAAAVLAANLRRFPSGGRTLALCGMLADKDVPAVIAQLRDDVDGWWAATTDGPRGLSDAALANLAAGAGVTMRLGGTVTEAMRSVAAAASAGDRIVVFGSFHTVGPALSCV